jgi:putative transcriptional regulator
MTLTPEDIKRIRAKLGMTQAQLAERLQVTLDTIKSWEIGRNRCKGAAEVLLRMLDEETEGGGLT